MSQMLMVVMAIVLLATVSVAGMSGIRFGAVERQSSTQLAASGFRALEQAYAGYRIANRAAPESISDIAPFVGAGLPRPVAGFSWGFGTDARGAFLCLSGLTPDADTSEGLRRLADGTSRGSLPPSAVTFGPSCASSGPFGPGRASAVTYHLVQ